MFICLVPLTTYFIINNNGYLNFSTEAFGLDFRITLLGELSENLFLALCELWSIYEAIIYKLLKDISVYK